MRGEERDEERGEERGEERDKERSEERDKEREEERGKEAIPSASLDSDILSRSQSWSSSPSLPCVAGNVAPRPQSSLYPSRAFSGSHVEVIVDESLVTSKPSDRSSGFQSDVVWPREAMVDPSPCPPVPLRQRFEPKRTRQRLPTPPRREPARWDVADLPMIRVAARREPANANLSRVVRRRDLRRRRLKTDPR